MSEISSDPLDHPEVHLISMRAALLGTILALAAMAVAFLLTVGQVATPLERLIAVGFLAIFALISQMLFVFRLGIGEVQIWKTVALVLVLPLFVVSIGLTDLMFHSLAARTMLHASLSGS